MVERIVTTLGKGCNLDAPPRFQPEGTWRWARNVQKNTKRGKTVGLTNEGSTKRRADIPGHTPVGYLRIEERNATIIFHKDGGSAISIFYHDTGKLEFVVRDTEFGCDWKFTDCMWTGHGHSGSKTIAPCNDLLVYFISDDFCRVVNVDEMLDPKRKAAVKELENPCEHFLTIKPISGPRVKARALRGGGKDLEGGQYYFFARFKDESGNESNFTPIHGPVYIDTKHNLPGEKSRQSVRIEVRNMSKHYSRVEICVIPPVGSQAQDVAYSIYDGVYNTNGVSVVYYSMSQHLSMLPMAQVLAKDVKWVRPNSMFIDQARLNLYRLRQPFNYNGQRRAMDIKVTFLAYLVPADSAHLFKSLPRDEPIALGIGYKSIDQLFTPFFHIPGPGGGSNDLDCGCTLPPGHTANNSQVVKEYAKIDGQGNIYCYTSGQTSTSNPDTTDVYNPPSKCAETPQSLTPRESEGASCNTGEKYEELQDEEIQQFTSTNDSLDPCLDCPPDSVRADLDHVENSAVRGLEHFIDLFRTDKEVKDDCSLGKHSTIPGAAHDGYDKAIKDAIKNEEVSYRTIVEKKDGTDFIVKSAGGTGERLTRVTVKGDDCSTEDVVPILWKEFSAAGWESEILYPKTKDCDGNYFYGDAAGERQRFPKTPGVDICPLFVSAQTGVDSRFDPSNIPGKRDTYAVILGVRLSGIHIPTDDEVFTPLDKNEPYRIGIVPPQDHNRSVLYYGYFTPTFEGKVGGKTFQFQRHGVSAFPNVDRSIDDNGSRKGKDSDLPIYTFHSPDIIGGTSFVYGDYVKIDGILSGDGMVYGQYAKGKAVKEDENRKDRRGSRGAVSLMKFEAGSFQTCLKGAEVAEHNSVLQSPTGIQRPLMNKYRESCIYLETDQTLPAIGEGNKDRSFTGGGLDHEYLTSGVCWFGSIRRFNTQQYGSVEALQYADLGLIGRPGQTTIEGPVGTCFVQKWSHKRTSYVSDKVGNYLNEDLAFIRQGLITTEEYLGPPDARKRGVPDPPNRRNYRMEEYLGFWNSQRLPETGDKRDPKNMANLFPTYSAQEIAAEPPVALTDLYFPRTHTQLNHLYVQTDVNLYYRSTNEPATREVFYEKLHGLEVDSSFAGVDPEDSWLNDFHSEQVQPSDKQQEMKIRIRTFLGLIMPALLMAGFAGMASEIEATSTVIAAPGLLFLWRLANFTIFTSKKIDKFKGIPHAKMDKEGAQENDKVKGLKDNWGAYNWGFSDINDINTFLGQPHPYITCKCLKYSNVIRTSNQQIHTSPYDAWSNFQALSLMGLEGDSGQLQLVVAWNNQVLAHTTDGFYPLQHKNTTIPTSMGEQVLGTSQYLPNPPRMRAGAFEGFAGTEDPNAGIIFEGGYVSIDYEGRGINILGTDFRKINDEECGIYHELRDNFTFCSKGACRDMMSKSGVHFALGYDPERKLLLITKHDAQPWTWSYDLRSRQFVAQHDYHPQFYFWDRNKMFSVKDGVIWEHNAADSFCNFYGKDYPMYVEVPVHTKDSAPFEYVSSILDTEVRVGNLYDREATFSDVLVYNESQTTGNLPMVVSDRNDGAETVQNRPQVPVNRDVAGLWNFNHVRANQVDRDIPVMIDMPCGQPDEFNEKNVTFDKTHVHTREVLSKFLIFKFGFQGEMNKIKASESEIVMSKLVTDVEIHESLRRVQ